MAGDRLVIKQNEEMIARNDATHDRQTGMDGHGLDLVVGLIALAIGAGTASLITDEVRWIVAAGGVSGGAAFIIMASRPATWNPND